MCICFCLISTNEKRRNFAVNSSQPRQQRKSAVQMLPKNNPVKTEALLALSTVMRCFRSLFSIFNPLLHVESQVKRAKHSS